LNRVKDFHSSPEVFESDSSVTPASRAAYCDVDGTLADTNIVTPLIYTKQRALSRLSRWAWLAMLSGRIPIWWLVDQFSRSASNRAIYSNYRGVSSRLVTQLANSYYLNCIKPNIFPKALTQLHAFRSEEIRLVLVTGGLDIFMLPMAQDLDADCLAPALEQEDGVFTGKLVPGPFTGETKAEKIRQHSIAHRIDLNRSYALGDAIGDLPMLEVTGNPIAVNPDRRLSSVARKRNWRIEHWS
jgi:HAD superfamily hydrolase (TIGR01490 family)